eukprot:g5130.t1
MSHGDDPCVYDVQVSINASNPDAVMDFSGTYSLYTTLYTSYAYENVDPLPSSGSEALYLGSFLGGCGSWVMSPNPILVQWDIGSTYWILNPIAGAGDDDSEGDDGEDDGDCILSAPPANELRGGDWEFVCNGCEDYAPTTAPVTIECLTTRVNYDDLSSNDDDESLPSWTLAVVIVSIVVMCLCCEKARRFLCGKNRQQRTRRAGGTNVGQSRPVNILIVQQPVAVPRVEGCYVQEQPAPRV